MSTVKKGHTKLMICPYEVDAGDRFALPMHLAYETGVVTTLPA